MKRKIKFDGEWPDKNDPCWKDPNFKMTWQDEYGYKSISEEKVDEDGNKYRTIEIE